MEESSIKYSVASVVSNKNRVEIFDLIPKLAGLSHMRYWQISYEMPFGRDGFDNMMSADEWNAFVNTVLGKANFRLKIEKLFPFDLYEKIKRRL